MKKWMVWIAAMLLIVLFAACGGEEVPTVDEQPSVDTEQETSQQPQEEEDAQPAEEEEDQAEEEEETQPVEEETPAAVDLAEVRDAIISGLSVEGALMLQTEALMNLYNIPAEQVAQSACFVTMSGTFPDEIIMIEAVDAEAAAAIAEKLQARLDEVMVQSKNYDPENYKAAQACVVRVNGLFVCLILSPNQAEMAEIYESYMN